jgi:hypothetical protein
VTHHRADLAEPSLPDNDAPVTAQNVASADTAENPVAARAETRVMQRTRERYAAIQQLKAAGQSITAIARTLRLHRHTVRRVARAHDVDDLLATSLSRTTILDRYKHHLHQRFNDGHTDAAALYREIREQGYPGSRQTVRHYLQRFRPTGTAPPAPPAVPKTRHVVRWLMTNPNDLDPDDQRRLDQILQRSPHLPAAAGHVRRFASMMKDLAGHRLPDWIRAVAQDNLPALHSFAKGIRRDFAAVTAGLTHPYSSGVAGAREHTENTS